MWKNRTMGRFAILLIVPALLTAGCASMSNTEGGALAGGAVGAGTGAAIGSATGHTGVGALIGAGVGTVTGAVIGNGMDKEEKRQEQQIAAANAAAAARQLQLTDVATMAQQHFSDQIIINQIHTTGSVYNLTAQQLIWLREQGVSEAVIAEMQATAYRIPARVYTERPVVVYEAAPAPVGVSFGYYHHWR
jgi:hypothetical protein